MLIMFYFLFCIFEIFSSGYHGDFKKVDKIPPEIVCYDYSKIIDSEERKQNNLLHNLDNHCDGFLKSNYCIDMKHLTGACIKKNKNYEIVFSDAYSACTLCMYTKEPFAIGVSKNIVILWFGEDFFWSMEVPTVINKEKNNEEGYGIPLSTILTPIKITFDERNAQYFIKNNTKLYCFPGNEGEFYFTFDPVNKTELYLLTIKKSISVPSEVKKPDGSKKFFTPTKILLCSSFAIGIFLFIFRNFIKNKIM